MCCVSADIKVPGGLDTRTALCDLATYEEVMEIKIFSSNLHYMVIVEDP